MGTEASSRGSNREFDFRAQPQPRNGRRGHQPPAQYLNTTHAYRYVFKIISTQVSAEKIIEAASTTPADLDSLRTFSKMKESKHLYKWVMIRETARDSFDMVCPAHVDMVKASDEVETANSIVSIFHATQAMMRSLKDDETRASVCYRAKRVMQKKVPQSLVQLLEMEIAADKNFSATPSVADTVVTRVSRVAPAALAAADRAA
jgi:hypothetical protein